MICDLGLKKENAVLVSHKLKRGETCIFGKTMLRECWGRMLNMGKWASEEHSENWKRYYTSQKCMRWKCLSQNTSLFRNLDLEVVVVHVVTLSQHSNGGLAVLFSLSVTDVIYILYYTILYYTILYYTILYNKL